MKRALGAIALIVAVGCGGATAPAPTVAASASPSPSVAAVNTPGTRDFVLMEERASGAQGTVHVDILASGYTFTVAMMGLSPNASGYFLNMHAGTCAVEDTSVLIDLGRFATDAGGTGMFKLPFTGQYVIPLAGRIVTLHGQLNTPAAFSHIACADLTN